jgi:peptidoglycan/xylan/chitin deacetylase (PgdA/CDA1 family)
MTRLPAVVLMAHDVGGSPATETVAAAGLSAPVPLLVDTIEAFRSRGYRFVKLAEFVANRDAGGVALLTFDDGYTGVGARAFPVLRELRVPALCFLVTECLGSGECFPLWLFGLRDVFAETPHEARNRLEAHEAVRDVLDQIGVDSLEEAFARPAKDLYAAFYPRLSFATLDRMRGAAEEHGMLRRVTLERETVLELQASGVFEFGAHTVDHRNLVHVPSAEAWRQVAESLRSVARLAGTDARDVAFAYPFGVVSPPARRAVEAVGRVGFTVAERAALRADCLSLLPRLTLDETVLQRAAKPPGYAALIGERFRIQTAPVRERARRLRNRLRRSRPRRLGAAR